MTSVRRILTDYFDIRSNRSTIKLMVRIVNFIFLLSILLTAFVPVSSVAAETTLPALIITEVKVRTDTNVPSDYDEYIELYNPSSEPIDLAQYNLEYYNTTNPPDSQQPSQKQLPALLLGSLASVVFAKDQTQIAFAQKSPLSSLSDTGGRLRLVSSEGQIIDQIAWTNTASLATAPGADPSIVFQCNTATAACNANRTQTITRSLSGQGDVVLVNAEWALASPTPQSSELLAYPTVDEDVDVPDDTNEVPTPNPQPALTCEGLVLSEVLPNPAGADGGHEYIELYNPTDEVISLAGCSLQVSSSTKSFTLPDTAMQPGAFLAFYDAVTGLTLPNSAGGVVWLLSPTEELDSVTYPGSLEDDQAWALIDSGWFATYTATPSAENILAISKPCPAGQTRNAETNRCQAVVVTAAVSLTPCKAGQERNPETNRCRSIATTTTSLVPCKAGQERNPETNRCRAITSDDELAPCAEGQERNPETNRCRKVTSAAGSTLASVTDVASPSNASPKWWIAIFAVMAAIAYGLYEWRRDIAVWIKRATSKIHR